ncbi:killer cell lectin-like receptor subfamily F member 1 [Emydura macquarii macquarii]|uniref:killer cell lectin-like receptor subfamily F member 1 n=1 Tax=Emydura macquarii macquarii TaxID=1129001 RepID=UPI00352BA843
MQDEEDYTVLNLRPKMEIASRPSASRIQDSPVNLRGYKIAVGILGAWSLVATLAVITLSMLGSSQEGAALNATESQSAQQRESNGAECSTCLNQLVSRLNQTLCVPSSSSSLEGSSCKICPSAWLPHGDKCYWFSTESKIWVRSRADCSVKNSRMVVIQEKHEMEFIGNSIQGKYYNWIGLSASWPGRKWTWVDGSSLNQLLFPVKGSAEENSCGVIKGSQIQSETCNGEHRWICQKDAILIDSGTSDLHL